ncbi:2-hydroxyacid dehydrogenase [Microbaculum marinisediminis]|uniref:Glyoxylate/hydroxypyruvate reductase A n=1 Tax=Microbaculum marinisediminis TaxID=2931392 RepID=A0AAW5QVA8_9HYPH|nr:glyoxylate/hydroxypyruvate reductase A [Microbaculum sp. A6E488]MCT8970844.1 glyoxylate/hydroxypyruvate reductase A [Microbaculum sp. A6E488]
MSILLAVQDWDSAGWVARFKRNAPDREIRLWPDATDYRGVRYAVCWKPPQGLLAKLPDLEVMFSLGAGVDAMMHDPELPDVPLVRIVDPSLTGRMTEWVVLQVLMHHRRQRVHDAHQRDKLWGRVPQPAADAVGVGIMGLGVLGRDAAEKLIGLGFDVAGWSRTPKDIAGVTCFHGEDGLRPFLARTDILVVLLPLTPDTQAMIDFDLLGGLRTDNHMGGAVLINAGRGGLQVEADILRALAEGNLSGATLDVFVEEPLPPESPFWTHPKVTVTPHVAAESDPDYLCTYILRQIENFEAGRPLENVVDRSLGY